jgi:hypothetical protein
MLCPAPIGVPVAASDPRVEPPIYQLVVMTRDSRITQSMVTCHATRITKHVNDLQLSATASLMLSPVWTSVCSTLTHPHWRHTMEEEYQAILSNITKNLELRPPRANLVTNKQFFKHKFKEGGSLDRYKAHWVLPGFTQCPSVDYDETFSLVMKPTTICTMLTLAISKG